MRTGMERAQDDVTKLERRTQENQKREARKAEKQARKEEKNAKKEEEEKRKAGEAIKKEYQEGRTKQVEQPPDDQDYDPYDHRTGHHLTKNWEAWVNLVKSSVGAGLLGMPNAFSQAGLICGLISTILIGSFCLYTLHILIHSMYEVCKWKKITVITYQDAMKEAILHGPARFHKAAVPMGRLVEFFLIFYQIGILGVYVVFISANLKQVIDVHFPDNKVSQTWYSIGVTLLLICLNQIRDLKRIAPVSVVANISLLFGIGCIFYYVFSALPNIKTVEMVASYTTYPLYLGTVLFALEAVAVIISVENHMKTPRSFPGCFGVLNLGMAVVVFLYSFVGLFGYWRYGKEAKGSITLNLAPQEILAQTAKMSIAFAILLTYPLQACPAVEVIWNKYLAKYWENGQKWRYIAMETFVRALIVLFSFILAVSVPDLDHIISLIGSFCLSMLAVGFPPIVHGFTFYPDRLGKYKWMMYKDILVFIAGFLTLVIGVYATLKGLLSKPK